MNDFDIAFEDLYERVCCSIVDSAPPRVTPNRFTGGFVGVVTTLMPGKKKDYHYHWLLTPTFNFLFDIYLNKFKIAEKYDKFRDEVIDLQVSNL